VGKKQGVRERAGESFTQWRPAATQAGGSKPVAAARPPAPAGVLAAARHSHVELPEAIFMLRACFEKPVWR